MHFFPQNESNIPVPSINPIGSKMFSNGSGGLWDELAIDPKAPNDLIGAEFGSS